MVQVFPEPVCPYAKMQTVYPSMQDITRGLTSFQTASWSDSSLYALVNSNSLYASRSRPRSSSGCIKRTVYLSGTTVIWTHRTQVPRGQAFQTPHLREGLTHKHSAANCKHTFSILGCDDSRGKNGRTRAYTRILPLKSSIVFRKSMFCRRMRSKLVSDFVHASWYVSTSCVCFSRFCTQVPPQQQCPTMSFVLEARRHERASCKEKLDTGGSQRDKLRSHHFQFLHLFHVILQNCHALLEFFVLVERVIVLVLKFISLLLAGVPILLECRQFLCPKTPNATTSVPYLHRKGNKKNTPERVIPHSS